MSGLVLKLRPAERIMINGAVIENGDRRTRLNVLTPKANVLRLRDAIHPDDANTPVKRVCYIAQLLLAGEAEPNEARKQILRGIAQLGQVFSAAEPSALLATARAQIEQENDYQALKSLRFLLPVEAALMEAAQ
jgi:flagellar protein FlbT